MPLPTWHCIITVWTVDDEGEPDFPLHTERRRFWSDAEHRTDIVGHLMEGYAISRDDGITTSFSKREEGIIFFANHFKEGY